MKQNYFDPAMKISTFSFENVVTTSGGITATGGQEAYNDIISRSDAQTQEITLADIRSNYVDMSH